MPQTTDRPKMRCVIHGSFRRHFEEIRRAHRVFTAAGIEVLAPADAELVTARDGFALFEDEVTLDPRLVELRYLHKVRQLGRNGFSYFMDPEGYLGASASYELGIAQVTNIPCFFAAMPADHPAYVGRRSVWAPEALAEYIATTGRLPEPLVSPDEQAIHALWEDLMVPGSVIAAGAVIEYDPPASRRREKDILLVRTHKWGGRWSVVGGKVRRNERLHDALRREIREETGLVSKVGAHLATFDQLKDSNYYLPGTHHVFVDNVAKVASTRVRLNEEAQEYAWMPARAALRDLDIEPNARHIVELYAAASAR